MAYLQVNDLNKTLNKIYYGAVKYKLRVSVNGVELENVDSYCEGVTIKHSIIPNGSKVFSLNSLISKEAELILHDLDLSILNGKISIAIDIPIEDGETEYIPIGQFNIEEKPTNDKDKTTITLRDNSVLLDHPYNAQPLIEENGGTATKLQIFQDICSKFGIQTNIEHFDNEDDEIGIYDSTVNARIYICDIAEQAGCIASFDRNGKLIFLDINDLYNWTLPFDLLEKYENGDSYKISRVVYEDAIRKFEVGDETNDTLYLDSANPYISSQEQVEAIYDKVKDFEINSLSTGMIIGNPLIDGYDLISFTNNNNETFTTLASYELRYTGVLTNTFNTQIGLEERTENVTLNGEASFRKFAKTNIDNINNNITMIVGEQNEQSEQITQITQNVSSIQNLFQITGGSNLIKNSQGLLDDNVWNEEEKKPIIGYDENDNPIYDENATTTFIKGYDAELSGKTVAVAKLGISNGKLSTKDINITNLLVGNRYTLNYFITNEEDTTTTIRLIGHNVIYEKTFDEECEMQDEVFEFVADTSNYILEIESTSLYDNFVYVYDLMLNSGDKKPWEPSIGEIVGTVIKLSQLGLQIYCTGSNIANLMTAQGFQIRRFQNGQLYEIITEFTDKGITTNQITYISDNMDGLIHKTIQSDGYKKYISYVGGGN